MALTTQVDMGGNTISVTDILVGDTLAGNGASGLSVSTALQNVSGVISSTGPAIISGSGAPTSSAARGTIYINLTGSTVSTRMYINTTGVSTWTAFTTLA